ncbi:tumor necrosis factor receptor superfamily member 13B [Megalops cyprinoides]|uniref:tumor necrosis factor receptor superfamily member 13B n=1 Tax=Megalops cyprinoides TaxID=118141 RepID=UPI0018642895|nr:tumor necrosis factor receptor superfamily member 13B [Megalops cyprinoides]
MSAHCGDGQFWDALVRQCLPCERACDQPYRRVRCAEFCVSLRCHARAGSYYDRLLKRCMSCTELCGSHPAECAHACGGEYLPQQKVPASAVSPTSLSETRPSLRQPPSPGLGGEHQGAVIYSLLGLCLAVLLCTLSLALLVLLWRSRGGRGARSPPREAETSESKHRPSSKDCLMEPVVEGWVQGAGLQKKTRPTETCMHCFPELRPCRRDDKPPTLYQQAAVTAAPGGTSQTALPCDKPATLRIICSPTQTST